MKQYILREAAIEEARKPRLTDAELRRRLALIPAADVVEVRHGRWINICGRSDSPRQCSECLQDFDYVDGIWCLVSGQELPNFCPSCGAKMDGGQEE